MILCEAVKETLYRLYKFKVVGLPKRHHPSFFFNAVKQDRSYDIYLTDGNYSSNTYCTLLCSLEMILKYYTHVISVFSLDSEVFSINLNFQLLLTII